MVVPNRAGIWGHMETTPFGHGAPFGKNQLRRMLADALFEVDHRQTLLAVPPQRPFGWMDRPLMKIAPRTGGLHVLPAVQIGRAHVRTPVTNAHLVCRLLLETKKHHTKRHTYNQYSV